MLLYRHFPVNPQKISAEAALFTEAPLSCMEFEILSSEIEREAVIYRPPTWNLHEHTLEYKNPTSNVHYTLFTLIQCLMGRELPPRLEAALDYSGFKARDKVAVFEGRKLRQSQVLMTVNYARFSMGEGYITFIAGTTATHLLLSLKIPTYCTFTTCFWPHQQCLIMSAICEWICFLDKCAYLVKIDL